MIFLKDIKLFMFSNIENHAYKTRGYLISLNADLDCSSLQQLQLIHCNGSFVLHSFFVTMGQSQVFSESCIVAVYIFICQ